MTPASQFDPLTFVADDHHLVLYRPRWNRMTGGVTATLLLQQIVYRWVKSGRRPFYKFASPCDHPAYRFEDSWEEELGLTRHEFEGARSRLATRTKAGEIAADTLVSYWMTTGHYTWYAVNETLLAERLAELYNAEAATDQVDPRLVAAVEVAQMDAVTAESHSPNPATPLPESGNGKFEPLPESGNGVAGKRQQKIRDQHKDDKEQREPKKATTAAATPATAAAPPPLAAAAARANGLAIAPDFYRTILALILFPDALKAVER